MLVEVNLFFVLFLQKKTLPFWKGFFNTVRVETLYDVIFFNLSVQGSQPYA